MACHSNTNMKLSWQAFSMLKIATYFLFLKNLSLENIYLRIIKKIIVTMV